MLPNAGRTGRAAMDLHAIQDLLKKQKLVEGVIRSQQHPSHEVVETLVQRQHLAELENALAGLPASALAYQRLRGSAVRIQEVETTPSPVAEPVSPIAVPRITFSRLTALVSVWRTRSISRFELEGTPVTSASTSSSWTKIRAFDS